MAPRSSTLAWKFPWTEEPGRLQSMGSGRVRHDWTTSLSLFPFMHWRRKWQPTSVFCLENPRDGVAQIWTWLKWLSSSSRLTCILLQSKNSTAGHKASVWKLSWKKKCAVLCISFHPGMGGGAQFLSPLRLNWPCHFINRMGEAKLNWF